MAAYHPVLRAYGVMAQLSRLQKKKLGGTDVTCLVKGSSGASSKETGPTQQYLKARQEPLLCLYLLAETQQEKVETPSFSVHCSAPLSFLPIL